MFTESIITVLESEVLGELDMEEISPEKRETLLADMAEQVQDRVILRAIEEMSPEAKQKFLIELKNSTIDSGIQNVIRNNLPNIDQLVKEELEKYKQEMLKLFA